MEWLLTGEGIKCTSGTADTEKTFLAPTGRDLYEYLNGVCQIDYATAGERLKQARELAGITVEEAATRAYLKTDALRHLEDESYFTTEHTDLQQIACLAYIYDVDLYWVFSGKARPPAAVLKDGIKNYPPYEFMLKQFPVPTAAGSTSPAASGIKFSKDELNFLDSYSYLSTSGKEAVKTLLAFQLERENLSSSSSLKHDIKKDKLALFFCPFLLNLFSKLCPDEVLKCFSAKCTVEPHGKPMGHSIYEMCDLSHWKLLLFTVIWGTY